MPIGRVSPHFRPALGARMQRRRYSGALKELWAGWSINSLALIDRGHLARFVCGDHDALL